MESTIINKPTDQTSEEVAAHNQKMIDKADGKVTTPDVTTTQEEVKAPEGTDTPTNKVTDDASDKTKTDSLELDATEGEKKQEEKAQTLLEKAGISLEDLQNEFTAKGELSEESYKKLTDSGFPKEMVDAYIEGQKAVADGIRNSLYEVTKGKDGYSDMVAWAKDNLSKDEKESFNKAVNSNPTEAKMAIKGLYAQYQQDNSSPKTYSGSPTASTSDVYESWSQVTADMSSPLYNKDPAFQAKVAAKLGRSSI